MAKKVDLTERVKELMEKKRKEVEEMISDEEKVFEDILRRQLEHLEKGVEDDFGSD